MAEEREQGKRNRRRRGRRGRGGDRPQQPNQQAPQSLGDGAPPGPPGPSQASSQPSQPRPDGRAPRRDTRGQPRREDQSGSRTHRAPSAGDRDRSPRSGGDRGPRRDGGYDRSRGSRDRDRGDRGRDSRIFEPPVPQDPISIELGAKFKESQIALRDAKKALDKRKAEFDDEPDWMLEQYAAAERAFEDAATAWSDHLGTTGRKVVRR